MGDKEYYGLKAAFNKAIERARNASPEEARRILIERGFLTEDGELPPQYQQPPHHQPADA